MDARELNAGMEGTAAYDMEILKEKLRTFSFSDIKREWFGGVGKFRIKLNPAELCMIHATVSPLAVYTAFFGFAVIRNAEAGVSVIPVFPAVEDGGFSITTEGDTVIFDCGWGYNVSYWILDRI